MEDRFGLGRSISAPSPKALSGLFFGVKEDPRNGRPIEITHVTMGATTLTKEEVEKYEKKRKEKVEADFLSILVHDKATIPLTKEKLRKAGKLKGLSPAAADAYAYKVALEKYSIETMKESFEDAKEWTANFLSSLKKGAFDTDKATNDLWQRVGVIGYDVPFIGKLTVADIRTFDWAGSLQIDNLIKQIKDIDYGKVASELVSSIAPEGGWADKGMEAFTQGCSMITSACSVASSAGLASVASGLGAVSTFLAAAAPWIAVAMLLVAIGEMIYGSWAEDKTAAQEASKQTTKILSNIYDALGASGGTSANEGTVALRIFEMAAYATSARRKTGTSSLKMLNLHDVDPRHRAGVNGCWADGSQAKRRGASFIYGDAKPSHFKKRKIVAVCLRDFASGVLSYLKQFNTGNFTVDMSDRRIAFEAMCVSIIPNATKYSVGLWPPEKPMPGSAFKVSTISPAEQQKILKDLVKNQPAWLNGKKTRTAISLFKAVIVRDANKAIMQSSTITHTGTFYGEGNSQQEADAAAMASLSRAVGTLSPSYGFALWARKGLNYTSIYEVEGTSYGGLPFTSKGSGGGPADPILLGGTFIPGKPGWEYSGLIAFSRDGKYKVFMPRDLSSSAMSTDTKASKAGVDTLAAPSDGALTKVMRPYAQTIVNFVNKRAPDPEKIDISTSASKVRIDKEASKAKVDAVKEALLKAKSAGDARKAQLAADPAARAQLEARKAELARAQNKAPTGLIALAAAAAGVYLMTKA